ncbi:MAG: hypothetical protein HYZ75_05930 [Elusimicrobia bacterium]|nr:hypothetical protein [Elusimicrobiota bacterium]
MRAAVLALFLASAAAAATPPTAWVAADPVFPPLIAELERSMSGLALEDVRPYYLAYKIVDQRRVIVEASLGALKTSYEDRRRLAGADLRVGSAAFDNTDFIGADGGGHAPFTIQVPYEDGPLSLRHALWWLSDAAFKSAHQRWSQKDAFRRAKNRPELLPDLTPAPVAVVDALGTSAALARSRAEADVRRASAVFAKYPALHGGRAAVYAWEDTVRFADSEGRRQRRDAARFQVVLVAWTQAPDGTALSQERKLYARGAADLPSSEFLSAQARELAGELAALSAAPAMERPYIGPVLFEGQAAGEFFNQLLAHGLEAPRELWLEDESQRHTYAPGPLTGRLELRVASPLLSAYDDPTQAAFAGTALNGYAPLDDEGVPARRVDLVEKGILKDLPLGRTPARERSGSNGHSRASLEHLPTPRTACLFIEAAGGLSGPALRAELNRRAAELGLPFGVVVRRLAADISVSPGSLLAAPLYAVKLYPDGREEPLRGAVFDEVGTRALRDVVAAGSERRAYNFEQGGPYGSDDDNVPASVVHPDALVSELVLVPLEREPDRLPYLPSPLAARK